MLRFKIALCATTICCVTPMAATWSHHSAAMFDRDKEITLQGTIKELLWVNPHSWIDIIVRDSDDKQVVWGIEASTPSGFVRMGMTRDPPNPKPGDKVTMVVHPLRDGRPGGSFVSMTMENGKSFYMVTPFGPAEPPPVNAPPPPNP